MSGASVDWNRLLAGLVHPTQAMILAAHEALGGALSPIMLVHVFEWTVPLSSVAYHVSRLADMGVLDWSTPSSAAVRWSTCTGWQGGGRRTDTRRCTHAGTAVSGQLEPPFLCRGWWKSSRP